MNYGTLTDNQLRPAPRAIRIGGAVRESVLLKFAPKYAQEG